MSRDDLEWEWEIHIQEKRSESEARRARIIIKIDLLSVLLDDDVMKLKKNKKKNMKEETFFFIFFFFSTFFVFSFEAVLNRNESEWVRMKNTTTSYWIKWWKMWVLVLLCGVREIITHRLWWRKFSFSVFFLVVIQKKII